MWYRLFALTVALILPVSAVAEDRVVDVSSVEKVAALMREAGYKAEIKQGKDGDAYIASATGGNGFQVNFYGCGADKVCSSFDFYSWYKKQPYYSVAMTNEWNNNKRFLKVAIDKDGDLAEFLSVSTLGGMTYDNFKDYIDWYESMDAELNKFLLEKSRAAGGK